MKRNKKTSFTSFYILLIVLLSTGFFYSCETGKQRQAFIRYNPGMSSRQFIQATSYFSQGEYDKAISVMNEVLKKYPDFAFGYFNRGMACMNIGETDKALADYNKAIELDPKFSQYYLMRGMLFCNMNKIDECISDRNRAIELDPENPTLYFQRGKTYLDEVNNFDQAISDFTRSIELKTNSPAHIYYFRGQAYMLNQQFDKARSDYNKAIQLDPKIAGWMNYTAGSNKDKVNTLPVSINAGFDNKTRTPPRAIRYVQPRFPFEAVSDDITGRVIVKLTVTKDGVVKDPVVLESTPEGIFDEAAIDCVKKWLFKPATEDGKPVDKIVRVPLKFGISSEQTKQ